MATKQKDLRLLAEVAQANFKAAGMDPPPIDVLEGLIEYGERFPKKRIAGFGELHKSGTDINDLLSKMLAEKKKWPAEHKAKAEVAEQTLRDAIDVIGIFIIRPDLRPDYLKEPLLQELADKIAKLLAELTKKEK